MSDVNGQELYRKHRPASFKEVVGQDTAVKVLSAHLKAGTVPHAVLLHGKSGTGKTTLARIMAAKLGCPEDSPGFSEINCASCDPMETFKGIQKEAEFRALGGGNRVWVLDEFQSLSRAGFAQQAILKVLEQAKKHAYFFLCTTDPAKIIQAVRERCSQIATAPVSVGELRELVLRVVGTEKKKLPPEVSLKIAELADGSPRKALKLLEDVIHLDTAAEQLECLQKKEVEVGTIDLCKTMMKPGVRWPEIAKILKALEGEEPEKVRRAVLGYCRSVLLSDQPWSRKLWGQAAAVINAFRDDTFNTGHPGLAIAAWEVFGEFRGK